MFPLAFALWLAEPATDDLNPLPALLPHVTAQSQPASLLDVDANSALMVEWTPRLRITPTQSVADDELSGLNQIGDKRKTKTRLNSDWASVSGQMTIRDPDWVRDDPLQRGQSWATDETLKVALNDALFVFGAIDAESRSVAQQHLKWFGKTGFGFKLRPWLLDEVMFRGGPGLRYDDEQHLRQGVAPERPELFVEVSTKLPVPLLGPINVEYTGTAIAALTATEQDRIKQNLRFALPLSDTSQFHVGAKWRNDDAASVTPFIDRAQLYLGVQLKR